MTNKTLYTDYIVPNKWNIFVQLMERPFDVVQKMFIEIQLTD